MWRLEIILNYSSKSTQVVYICKVSYTDSFACSYAKCAKLKCIAENHAYDFDVPTFQIDFNSKEEEEKK